MGGTQNQPGNLGLACSKGRPTRPKIQPSARVRKTRGVGAGGLPPRSVDYEKGRRDSLSSRQQRGDGLNAPSLRREKTRKGRIKLRARKMAATQNSYGKSLTEAYFNGTECERGTQ